MRNLTRNSVAPAGFFGKIGKMKYIRVLPAELQDRFDENQGLGSGTLFSEREASFSPAHFPNTDSATCSTATAHSALGGAQVNAQPKRVAHRYIDFPSKRRGAIKSEFLDCAEPDANGCWIWREKPDEYGQFYIGKVKYPAHRVSVRLFHKTFDQSLHVLHTCDVPGCVNPGHLWTGDDADNMQDCARKGRLPTQVNPGLVQGENNGQHKLTTPDVLEIRAAHARGESQKDLAARFHVKPPTIHKIVTRLKWRHLPDAPAHYVSLWVPSPVPVPSSGKSVVAVREGGGGTT